MAYKKNEKKLQEFFVKNGKPGYIKTNDTKPGNTATKDVRPRPQAN